MIFKAVLMLSTAFFVLIKINSSLKKGGGLVLLNGKQFNLEQEKTIAQLLSDIGVNIERVVVELNKEIIVREDFARINIKDDDTVEVISFVGGG